MYSLKDDILYKQEVNFHQQTSTLLWSFSPKQNVLLLSTTFSFYSKYGRSRVAGVPSLASNHPFLKKQKKKQTSSLLFNRPPSRTPGLGWGSGWRKWPCSGETRRKIKEDNWVVGQGQERWAGHKPGLSNPLGMISYKRAVERREERELISKWTQTIDSHKEKGVVSVSQSQSRKCGISQHY